MLQPLLTFFLDHRFRTTKWLTKCFLVFGDSLWNISAQIESIGKTHHNRATRRTTDPIKLIPYGLNRSAPLYRVRQVQRFSHNDSLKA